MSAHDRYQTAIDKTGARRSLGPAWDPKPAVQLKPKRTQVSMPRVQRPLFVGDAGFWPTDNAGWALCRWLALFNVTLWGVLIFSIATR